MNDRMMFPVIRLIIDRKPFEKVSSSLENCFERGDGERFTETPRAGKEIRSKRLFDQIPDEFGLVNVQVTVGDYFLKRKYDALQTLLNANTEVSRQITKG